MKNIYYRVKDNCESPVVFETLEEAIEYLKNCLDGINNECPVSIEKVEMTSDAYNQLVEM